MGRAMLKNIIIVNDHAFVNGGQAKVAIESAVGLARKGLNVVFFAACGPEDESLAAAGVKTVCLGQKDILAEPWRIVAMTRGVWNEKASKSLKAVLADFDPHTSIVHCHGFAKALSPAIGPVVTKGRLPHVYTMHEYFLACPNGGFFDYQNNGICMRRAMGLSCLTTNCDVRHASHKIWRVVRQAVLWTAGNMPRGLKHVIYISNTQKKVMIPYLPPTATLHHVPNPVSIQKKERTKAERNESFLFVGRLGPEKGGLLFAKAAKKAGVEAVFVGDGSERTAILKANPDARITGWVAADEVEGWLNKARCLVFPSLWYETFGLAAYEAIAKGIPVLCGKWNSAAEAVEKLEGGLLLSEASLEALTNGILKINTTIEATSSKAYLNYWAEPLNLTNHIERLLQVYKSAAAS